MRVQIPPPPPHLPRYAGRPGEVSEWPKERDWKSRTCRKVGRGFESLPLRFPERRRLRRRLARLSALLPAGRAAQHCPTGIRALSHASGNRSLLLSRRLLRPGSARLGQKGDEVVDLRRRQGLPEVRGHDVRLVAGRDLLVRIDDRLVDERRVLALERRVEIRADRPRGARRLERVAAPAALGREDDLAVRRLPLLRSGRWRRRLGKRRPRPVRAGLRRRLLAGSAAKTSTALSIATKKTSVATMNQPRCLPGY